jgi:hypothetical protein
MRVARGTKQKRAWLITRHADFDQHNIRRPGNRDPARRDFRSITLRPRLSTGLLLSFADSLYCNRIVKTFTLQKTYRIAPTQLIDNSHHPQSLFAILLDLQRRDTSIMLEIMIGHPMKIFRIMFGLLAIIPLALLVDKLLFHVSDFDEDSIRTLAFLVIGIPILILNLWAWIFPEISEFYFFGRDKPD